MPPRLTEAEIVAAATAAKVEPAALRAVISVESGGSGFLPDGRLKILLEGHLLWRRLQSRGIDPTPLHRNRPDLCFPRWTRRHYRGGVGEWNRVQDVLDWASAHAPERFESYKKAAYEACSWGLFQLLGMNHAAAGYANVYALKHDFETGEAAQLRAILRWMEQTGILPFLQRKQWPQFVRRYNGPGQVPLYSARLLATYWKARREYR